MRNQSIARIMAAPVVHVTPDRDLATVARLMLEHGIGSVLVVDEEERLVGIVTDSDFSARNSGIPFSTFRAPQVLGYWMGREGVERLYREAARRPVREIMSSPVHTVDEGGTLADVLQVMLQRNVKHVPVVREGRPVGMVARHDLLKLMLDEIET